MYTTYTILALLVVMLIGFLVVRWELKKVDEVTAYISNYFAKLKSVIEGSLDSKKQNETYSWLVINWEEAQTVLGKYGFIGIKPAGMAPYPENYAPTHALGYVLDAFRKGDLSDDTIDYCFECNLHFIGNQERKRKRIISNLKNPFVWFREGVRTIILSPVYLISWFGIFPSRTVETIRESLFMTILSGIAALVSFLSSLVTVLEGWPTLYAVYQQLITLLPK